MAQPQQIGADIGDLISMIIEAVAMARRNREECELLACRMLMINDLLLHLQDDPKQPDQVVTEQTLAGLAQTLREVHRLVTYCQRRNAVYRFFMAGSLANKFRDVQSRIDWYLNLFPFISHIDITRRLVVRLVRLRIRGATLVYESDTPSPSAGFPSIVCNIRFHFAHVLDAANIARKESHKVQEFTFQELVEATNNFHRVIGRGDFSRVCKGRLPDGRKVVVKRKNVDSGIEDEFLAEVTLLSQLSHKHIIRLLGWCVDVSEEEEDNGDQGQLLVMEYMKNGSLHDHLHNPQPEWSKSLVRASWKTRIDILLGVSRAIEYLHSYAELPVIHHDIKPSNILLDSNWAPCLSGFGTAIICDGMDRISGLTPKGTAGYVDPEYSRTHVLKPTSDVYNFGIVMLEVLTGKKPIFSLEDVKTNCTMNNPSSLMSFALPIIRAGEVRKLLDERPTQPMPKQLQPLEIVARTAARCVRAKGEYRPAMSDIVAELQQALDLTRYNALLQGAILHAGGKSFRMRVLGPPTSIVLSEEIVECRVGYIVLDQPSSRTEIPEAIHSLAPVAKNEIFNALPLMDSVGALANQAMGSLKEFQIPGVKENVLASESSGTRVPRKKRASKSTRSEGSSDNLQSGDPIPGLKRLCRGRVLGKNSPPLEHQCRSDINGFRFLLPATNL
uniref:Protein kinase domain-containing protein n=1 Tax=Leersia perrieri TaxID=77586 RepID=A0A0D9XV77_9ORYZ